MTGDDDAVVSRRHVCVGRLFPQSELRAVGCSSTVIAYRIEPRTSEPTDAIFAMRRSRARVLVLDAGLNIVGADRQVLRMLDDLGARSAGRVQPALEHQIRQWRAAGAPDGEFAAVQLTGIALRAVALEGPNSWTAVVLEPVCSRETLETATRRFGLSPRECDVLRLVLEGDSACEIGERLQIAEYTVGDYLKRIFAKTRVRNRSEMIAKVLGWRPLAPELV
jgi:DNA-binding CsgD family transcriptional regulator